MTEKLRRVLVKLFYYLVYIPLALPIMYPLIWLLSGESFKHMYIEQTKDFRDLTGAWKD